MKTLLIIDTTKESPFLNSIADLLSHREDISVSTASTDELARELLRENDVDLILTDASTAAMGGLSDYLRQHHPGIPIFAASSNAKNLPEELQESRISQLFQDPLDPEMIASCILDEFDAGAAGQLHSVRLSSFLQLVELENRTCTLTIRSKGGGQKGRLHFVGGELFAAETNDLENEAAAYEILGWEKASILIQNTCRKTKKQISEPLMKMLMKANRLKDEKDTPVSEPYEQKDKWKRETEDTSSLETRRFIEALHRVPGLAGYRLFDEKNRAIAFKGYKILAFDFLLPSNLFVPLQKIAATRGGHPHLLLHADHGTQLLLFERRGIRTVAALEPGYSAGEIVKKINRLL
jgi:CheY-like chemotaxis protein